MKAYRYLSIETMDHIPVIRPLRLLSMSALLSNSSRNPSSPWASCQLGPCVKARVRVPMKPITAVELERHSRLGGGRLSAMERLKEKRVEL